MSDEVVGVAELITTIESAVIEVSRHGPAVRPSRITDEDLEDDDYDRRPQRRRYEEPLAVKVRKQLLSIAESVRICLERCSIDTNCRTALEKDRR